MALSELPPEDLGIIGQGRCAALHGVGGMARACRRRGLPSPSLTRLCDALRCTGIRGSTSIRRISLVAYAIASSRSSGCACPICGEFAEALCSYHRLRWHWHNGSASGRTTCTGGYGLACKDQNSEFRSFSRNHGTFEQAFRCPKREREELALPHAPDQVPEFYKLTCCLRHKHDRYLLRAVAFSNLFKAVL